MWGKHERPNAFRALYSREVLVRAMNGEMDLGIRQGRGRQSIDGINCLSECMVRVRERHMWMGKIVRPISTILVCDFSQECHFDVRCDGKSAYA